MTGIIKQEYIGGQRLILGDCLSVMPELGRFDAVVTDPPYGIDRANGANGGGKCGKTGKPRCRKFFKGEWDDKPANISFIPMMGVPSIIWGGQYFTDQLPMSQSWLVWDKLQTMPTYGDGELAWTNSKSTTLRKFTYGLNAMISRKETGLHPTQKPVALMEWCLGFLPDAVTILDPFAGSGTTAVASQRMGRQCTAIERDPDYWAIMCRRVDEATRQPDLFIEPTPAPIQEGMDL